MPNTEDLERLQKDAVGALTDDERAELEKRNAKMRELLEQIKKPVQRKPILCLDFDGVCHSYTSGWKGADVIPDPPVDGLFDFLWKAHEYFEIHIFSTRSLQDGGIEAMRQWFEEWHDRQNVKMLPLPPLHFPVEKPPALVTLDDRAITFTGIFPSVDTLKSFKPWNK